MKVIGLAGSAGSGKDTVCGFALSWCEAHGIDAERVAFADPLKVSAARALGAPVEWTTEECVDFCNDLKRPEMLIRVEMAHKEYIDGVSIPMVTHELYAEITGRQYLQFYGTEAHRDVFGTSFWTDATAAAINQKEREGVDVVFITDVRFDNEGSFVAERGEVWAIERPGEKIMEKHASEEPLASELLDLVITNTGTLADLRDAVCLSCNDKLEVAPI